MKLYVCYGTWRRPTPLIAKDPHPCGVAHEALEDAGYEPDVVRALGWVALPGFLNQTPGRRKVKELTGEYSCRCWSPIRTRSSQGPGDRGLGEGEPGPFERLVRARTKLAGGLVLGATLLGFAGSASAGTHALADRTYYGTVPKTNVAVLVKTDPIPKNKPGGGRPRPGCRDRVRRPPRPGQSEVRLHPARERLHDEPTGSSRAGATPATAHSTPSGRFGACWAIGSR